MNISVDIVGGCDCQRTDGYCYCPGKDVEIYATCGTRKCKQKHVRIYELSDQYSLARWLTENYTPKE